MPELAFRPLVKEPLVVVLRVTTVSLRSKPSVRGISWVRRSWACSNTAPVLRGVIDDYLKRSGIHITPAHEVDHVVMGVSLIASTGGVGVLPCLRTELSAFLCNESSSQGIHRPMIELVLGYKKSNESPALKLLLSRWTS